MVPSPSLGVRDGAKTHLALRSEMCLISSRVSCGRQWKLTANHLQTALQSTGRPQGQEMSGSDANQALTLQALARVMLSGQAESLPGQCSESCVHCSSVCGCTQKGLRTAHHTYVRSAQCTYVYSSPCMYKTAHHTSSAHIHGSSHMHSQCMCIAQHTRTACS